MLASGTTTIEMAVLLETVPDFRPWAWYGGALNQYHTAFLLLMEVYVYPHRKEADRIWACLDYIFECEPRESRQVKGKKILGELQQKTAIYQNMRGMRAPVVMEKHLGQRPIRITNPSNKEQNLRYLGSPTRDTKPPAPPVIPSPPKNAALFVGRVPIPDIQFAGVSDGESLWALPNQKSPEASSDSNSISAGPIPSLTTAEGDDLMADIDWVSFICSWNRSRG